MPLICPVSLPRAPVSYAVGFESVLLNLLADPPGFGSTWSTIASEGCWFEDQEYTRQLKVPDFALTKSGSHLWCALSDFDRPDDPSTFACTTNALPTARRVCYCDPTAATPPKA